MTGNWPWNVGKKRAMDTGHALSGQRPTRRFDAEGSFTRSTFLPSISSCQTFVWFFASCFTLQVDRFWLRCANVLRRRLFCTLWSTLVDVRGPPERNCFLRFARRIQRRTSRSIFLLLISFHGRKVVDTKNYTRNTWNRKGRYFRQPWNIGSLMSGRSTGRFRFFFFFLFFLSSNHVLGLPSRQFLLGRSVRQRARWHWVVVVVE